MALPPKKQSVEERATYLTDLARLDGRALLMEQNQKQLKKKGFFQSEEQQGSRGE